MSEQNRERDKFIIEQSKKDGISGVDEVYVNTRCREAWDASRDALQVLHEKWCPHFHVEYMKVKEELAALLESAGEFESPDVEGSQFHELVVNQSISHGNRNEPAWVYSIRDAVVGARWQHEQAKVREAALVSCKRIAENKCIQQAQEIVQLRLDVNHQTYVADFKARQADLYFDDLQAKDKELAALQFLHETNELCINNQYKEIKELREENEKLKASYIKGHAKGLELGRSNCVDAQAKLTEQSELLRECLGKLGIGRHRFDYDELIEKLTKYLNK